MFYHLSRRNTNPFTADDRTNINPFTADDRTNINPFTADDRISIKRCSAVIVGCSVVIGCVTVTWIRCYSYYYDLPAPTPVLAQY